MMTNHVELKYGGRKVEVALLERRLVTPPVYDVVAGRSVLVGPRVDTELERRSFLRSNPGGRYAVAKRQLSRSELKRFGLANESS